LDVRPIRAPQHAPVQPTQLIARDIKPMLAKLDAGPLERALVDAAGATFDDAPGRELHAAQPLHQNRIEISADEAHGGCDLLHVSTRLKSGRCERISSLLHQRMISTDT